jgi:predicted RNA-binding Zn-ribbon protein involved in translation (DUF1610 family)
MIAIAKIELARMGVAPFCPKCGSGAIFMRPQYQDRHGVDTLVPTKCSQCDWEGVSRRTVPQPRVMLDTRLSAVPQAEQEP